MDLENVFAFVRMIGGTAPAITIVGCEPSGSEETLELTEPVRQAVQPAAELVRKLVVDVLASGQHGRERNGVWTEA